MMVGFSPDLAEICGIHAGDGHLRNAGHRRELDISGAIGEFQYYDEHVVLLFEKVFGIKPKTRLFPSRNTYGFVIRDVSIIECLHSVGFPYGRKTLTVAVPGFVLDSKNLDVIYAFLRGVFDTDGCLSFGRRGGSGYKPEEKLKHAYPRIRLSICSKPLWEGVQKLLMATGFNFRAYVTIPKGKNESPKYAVVLPGYAALERWMHNIGFKNPSKLLRYEIWRLFGFCPKNLSCEQMRQILNKQLDPNSFYE